MVTTTELHDFYENNLKKEYNVKKTIEIGIHFTGHCLTIQILLFIIFFLVPYNRDWTQRELKYLQTVMFK